MLAYRKKAPLLHAFKQWKVGLKVVSEKLRGYNRNELISLIAKMDYDIHSLENLVE